jgi:hypothetical protein
LLAIDKPCRESQNVGYELLTELKYLSMNADNGSNTDLEKALIPVDRGGG